MPDSLRRQLYISLNKKLFTNMPLFKFCDVQCILALVDRLKPCIFMPGDFIIRQGTYAQALYFINRGRVLVLKNVQQPARHDAQRDANDSFKNSRQGGTNGHGELRTVGEDASEDGMTKWQLAMLQTNEEVDPEHHKVEDRRERLGKVKSLRGGIGKWKDGRRLQELERAERQRTRVLALLEENDIFGEQSLLMNRPSNCSVRTLNYCEMMVLQAKDFKDVVSGFPSFAEVSAVGGGLRSTEGTCTLLRCGTRHAGPLDTCVLALA